MHVELLLYVSFSCQCAPPEDTWLYVLRSWRVKPCQTCHLTTKVVNYAADHFEFLEVRLQKWHSEMPSLPAMKRTAQRKKAISCGSGAVSCFHMYKLTNTSCLELSKDDLTEINTISTGSLMGHKTHLIVGCHNAFGHIGPRRDMHVMSATAPLRQLAAQDSDRPSWLTVSDSYLGRALPHQSSAQGQTEVTGAPLSAWWNIRLLMKYLAVV